MKGPLSTLDITHSNMMTEVKRRKKSVVGPRVGNGTASHQEIYKVDDWMTSPLHTSFDESTGSQNVSSQEDLLSPSSTSEEKRGSGHNSYKVIEELIESERTYVKNLQDIIEGYLENVKKETTLPITNEDIENLFINIENIYNFNKGLLDDVEKCDKDPVQVAECFVLKEKGFHIYTKFCTNYPRSVDVLTECMKKKEIAKCFQEQQVKLAHPLPLGSYLLKPVQRILKYHLLFKHCLKYFDKDYDIEGYEIIQEALATMTDIAEHINEMKRKHEAILRVQEIQSSLTDFDGPDFTTYGKLILEDCVRMYGAKTDRYLYLFEKILLVTKKRNDNSYIWKLSIMCTNLMLYDSVPKDPLSFQIILFDDKKVNYIFQARTLEMKKHWTFELKKLILETHTALVPMKAKQIILGEELNRFDDELEPERKRRPHSIRFHGSNVKVSETGNALSLLKTKIDVNSNTEESKETHITVNSNTEESKELMSPRRLIDRRSSFDVRGILSPTSPNKPDLTRSRSFSIAESRGNKKKEKSDRPRSGIPLSPRSQYGNQESIDIKDIVLSLNGDSPRGAPAVKSIELDSINEVNKRRPSREGIRSFSEGTGLSSFTEQSLSLSDSFVLSDTSLDEEKRAGKGAVSSARRALFRIESVDFDSACSSELSLTPSVPPTVEEDADRETHICDNDDDSGGDSKQGRSIRAKSLTDERITKIDDNFREQAKKRHSLHFPLVDEFKPIDIMQEFAMLSDLDFTVEDKVTAFENFTTSDVDSNKELHKYGFVRVRCCPERQSSRMGVGNSVESLLPRSSKGPLCLDDEEEEGIARTLSKFTDSDVIKKTVFDVTRAFSQSERTTSPEMGQIRSGSADLEDVFVNFLKDAEGHNGEQFRPASPRIDVGVTVNASSLHHEGQVKARSSEHTVHFDVSASTNNGERFNHHVTMDPGRRENEETSEKKSTGKERIRLRELKRNRPRASSRCDPTRPKSVASLRDIEEDSKMINPIDTGSLDDLLATIDKDMEEAQIRFTLSMQSLDSKSHFNQEDNEIPDLDYLPSNSLPYSADLDIPLPSVRSLRTVYSPVPSGHERDRQRNYSSERRPSKSLELEMVHDDGDHKKEQTIHFTLSDQNGDGESLSINSAKIVEHPRKIITKADQLPKTEHVRMTSSVLSTSSPNLREHRCAPEVFNKASTVNPDSKSSVKTMASQYSKKHTVGSRNFKKAMGKFQQVDQGIIEKGPAKHRVLEPGLCFSAKSSHSSNSTVVMQSSKPVEFSHSLSSLPTEQKKLERPQVTYPDPGTVNDNRKEGSLSTVTVSSKQSLKQITISKQTSGLGQVRGTVQKAMDALIDSPKSSRKVVRKDKFLSDYDRSNFKKSVGKDLKSTDTRSDCTKGVKGKFTNNRSGSQQTVNDLKSKDSAIENPKDVKSTFQKPPLSAAERFMEELARKSFKGSNDSIHEQSRMPLEEQVQLAATRGLVANRLREGFKETTCDDAAATSHGLLIDADEDISLARGLVKKRLAYHVRQQSAEGILLVSDDSGDLSRSREDHDEDLEVVRGIVKQRVENHKRRGSEEFSSEGERPLSHASTEEEVDLASVKGLVRGLVDRFNTGEVSNTDEEDHGW